jgi:predicted ester cyclase
MLEDLKAIGHQLAELWNTGNLFIADEIFANDFVNHDPSRPEVTDIEGYKKYLIEKRSVMPDFKVDIEDMVAEEDKLASRYTVSGTFQNDFFGILSTGKKAT